MNLTTDFLKYFIIVGVLVLLLLNLLLQLLISRRTSAPNAKKQSEKQATVPVIDCCWSNLTENIPLVPRLINKSIND